MKRKVITCLLLTLIFTLAAVTWLAGSLLTSPALQAIGPPPSDLPVRPVQFASQSGSSDLRPIDHIGQLKAPKLFITGANDRSTTLEESQRLYETASAPKDFWVVPGAAHVDLHNFARVEYEQRVLDFFGRNLR